MSARISRELLFTEQVKLVALRSTCTRAQVGAIIVVENRPVSQGYAGSPAGMPHCIDEGCDIGPGGGCQRTIHAEVNAVAFAAKHGIAVDKAHLYCTLSPCLACAKLLINSGIKEVSYITRYRDDSGILLLLKADIKVNEYDEQLKLYKRAY